MIIGYFGVPGCGKTTMLSRIAQKELKRKNRRYTHIYTNFPCRGCESISFDDLNNYKLYNSLILIDEITLDADSRDFKNFPLGIKMFMILHRHVHCDIIYFCQDFSRCDKTIRALTSELWYLEKLSPLPFLNRFSIAKRIFRNITINEMTSELTLGYRFCTTAEAFSMSTKKIIYRPSWYKFFDSYDEMQLRERDVFTSADWCTDNTDCSYRLNGLCKCMDLQLECPIINDVVSGSEA